MATQHTGSGLGRYVPISLIFIAAVAGAVTLHDSLSFEALSSNRETLMALRDSHYALAVAGFIAVYVAIVSLSLPGASIATLTGGFLFGLFPGTLYNVISATLGATAIFLAARWGLGDRLSARLDSADGATARLRDGIRDNQMSFLFVMRLVPAVPFFVANLVPALVGVDLWRFVVTTFLGIIPGAIVYTWVGAGLGEVFSSGTTPDLKIIFSPMILGPILALAALAAAPAVIKSLRRRKART